MVHPWDNSAGPFEQLALGTQPISFAPFVDSSTTERYPYHETCQPTACNQHQSDWASVRHAPPRPNMASPITLPYTCAAPPAPAMLPPSARAYSHTGTEQIFSENIFPTPVQLLGELAESRRRGAFNSQLEGHSSGVPEGGDPEEMNLHRSTRHGPLPGLLGFPSTDP